MKLDEKDQIQTKREIIREKLMEQQSEAKLVRKIVFYSIIAIVSIILITGIGGYFYVSSALKPVDPDDKAEKKVTIPIGSSLSTIATVLEEEGVIKNARVFKYYLKFRNESGFQAGEYNLSPSMTLQEITDSIKTGKLMKEVALKITIPEGKQLQQIADIIAEKTNQDGDKLFKQLNDKKFIEKMQDKFPNILTDDIFKKDIKYPLEGYLYPATYDFEEKQPTLETIVSAMLTQTEKIVQKYEQQLTEQEMSVHKLLTFASLIEEEATEQVDRDTIASVFYNRLDEDMPLQTDPTVLYAHGEHKNRVLYKDLEIDSPYNTYKYRGLTPGPIANAGETSILAVLEPEDTDYLYFLATPEGQVLFSKTLDEHNRKKAEHITNQ